MFIFLDSPNLCSNVMDNLQPVYSLSLDTVVINNYFLLTFFQVFVQMGIHFALQMVCVWKKESYVALKVSVPRVISLKICDFSWLKNSKTGDNAFENWTHRVVSPYHLSLAQAYKFCLNIRMFQRTDLQNYYRCCPL